MPRLFRAIGLRGCRLSDSEEEGLGCDRVGCETQAAEA